MTYYQRTWFPGAILHITARGNHKNDIFLEENDFENYYTILKKSLEHFKGKFEIHSYCLMTNHIHLLIKTDDLHIWNFMSRVNSAYALYFNKKYDCIGHLYQGRYFAEIMDDDIQLLTASRYIHLNPVKPHIVKKPEDYKWSSYSMFLGINSDNIVNSKMILSYFGKDKSIELYKAFVESGIVESPPGVVVQ